MAIPTARTDRPRRQETRGVGVTQLHGVPDGAALPSWVLAAAACAQFPQCRRDNVQLDISYKGEFYQEGKTTHFVLVATPMVNAVV